MDNPNHLIGGAIVESFQRAARRFVAEMLIALENAAPRPTRKRPELQRHAKRRALRK